MICGMADNMRNKQLQRLRKGRVVAGVCAGLAEQFGVSVTILRLAFVLGTLVSGFMLGVVIYLVLWVVMPYRPTTFAPAIRSGTGP
jgi:phage shock protein PspC (stress-responsive transcriptional regulator)